MTTGKATTTPQINDLIGWMRKNNRAARAARTYEQVRAVLCKQQHEITTYGLPF